VTWERKCVITRALVADLGDIAALCHETIDDAMERASKTPPTGKELDI
jgi:hypothetical protein